MSDFNRFIAWYMRHVNKLFWLVFLLAAGVFVYATFFGYMYLDLVIGLIVIFVGVHWIGQELYNRRMREIQDNSIRTINELLQWAEKSYDYTRAFKDKHEKRLHRLDVKRGELEAKAEDQFRDAVKKIIDLENRLNKLARSLDNGVVTEKTVTTKTTSVPSAEAQPSVQPRLADLSPTQRKAIDYIRRNKRITNKEYRQSYRISEKKAYNELYSMYQMGILKRVGKGRNTHYVLAF